MPLLREKDFGTPKPKTDRKIRLTIDGRETEIEEGASVMRAAEAAGISVPKLCATDMLKSFGSCRLCLVEIDGRKGTPASCTTPVADGMKVKTQSPRLAKLRRSVMELYISDHPLACETCSDDGDCDLQSTAAALNVADTRFTYDGANHFAAPKDVSNPYFEFDPTLCIVCSRCVRACDEVQGTLALTIEGRGFHSKVGFAGGSFFESECVSCGACVDACPTGTLQERTVAEMGVPDRSVLTTCAYCGVGCSFKAELKGDQVVRMTPHKDGKANHGHSCVKGRFAWGYASHKDRITAPMIREKITDHWREATWDEAIAYAARRLKETQEKYGRKSIGAISSSRCTIEEVWVVQKMVRTAFANNNIDTCARVCHSPTGYGLKKTYGTSAGTQDFDSVEEADVMLLIGANPTDAHPVFASQMKRRLREGAKLIIADPRAIDLVRTPPRIEAAHHLQLQPGTNVPLINAFAHVAATEGLLNDAFINERCDVQSFREWLDFIKGAENSPETVAKITGVPAEEIRAAARLYASARNSAIYYGLGVTEHSQGSTMVMGMANLAMATGNIGRRGVGVNPLRGQNNVQGSCDMGSFPHEYSGYRHVSEDATRAAFEKAWGRPQDKEPGFRIPNMFDEAVGGGFKGLYVQGEDVAQSDPNTQHVEKALRSLDILIVHDLFLNETARFAHVFFPGASFLEKDGSFINAERRIGRVRAAIPAKCGLQEWEAVAALTRAMGYDMNYASASEIMDEIAALTPTFASVSHRMLDEKGSVQWPCNDAAPDGTPIVHVGGFVRGKGLFVPTDYVPTPERTNRKFPLILTTGRILSQYNVGAQTRRTDNVKWQSEDVLEIHQSDAETRGIRDGDWVSIRSRKGEITLRAKIAERMAPGVVYTTFHHPETGANVLTTELADWATQCPEYKVTAVEVAPANHRSDWQIEYGESLKEHRRIAEAAVVEPAK